MTMQMNIKTLEFRANNARSEGFSARTPMGSDYLVFEDRRYGWVVYGLRGVDLGHDKPKPSFDTKQGAFDECQRDFNARVSDCVLSIEK